jgi:hypothetical protein
MYVWGFVNTQLLMEHSGTDSIYEEKSNSGLGEEDKSVYIGGVTKKLTH